MPVQTTPPRTTQAVTIRDLRKNYETKTGTVAAVRGVDLAIGTGEVVAVLGPNGAGKSTTVATILGLTQPSAGTVEVFGKTPRDAVTEGLVGAMLQQGNLLEDVTVAEVIGMIAGLHKHPMPAEQAMRMAGVTDIADRYCTKLSGGQRQRVRFAMALVGDPRLLVLDEPTAAMDVGSRRDFWQAMRSFTDTGRTVLFATHYLDEAEEFADRVVLLRDGRVVADGTVAEVRGSVTGSVLRAVVPGATLADLLRLPGVTGGELRGDRAELSCDDSDTALRALLVEHPLAHHFQITAMGLEEAFLSLTSTEEPLAGSSISTEEPLAGSSISTEESR
ncbi:ABC transporter ATP-binding protein [Labedaea rhizosphaerae]|uniref:ABC transporter ATP-binding protein n=1 Tax=Labedaea rhizosphaerae TaxID=598644 RepID=UPI00105F25D6|nr:ABC transporter ATP-binding protein [Labedaea rhizosphaerae]